MKFKEFLKRNIFRNQDFIVGYDGVTMEEIQVAGADFITQMRGAKGDSVRIEFSVDGSENWHYPGTKNDNYIRFKVGNDAYSVAYAIKGTDGTDGTGIYRYHSDLPYQIGEMYTITDYTNYVDNGVYLKINDLVLGSNCIIARVYSVGSSEYPNSMTCKSFLNIQGIPGLSAFEIWLNNGGNGGEQDFLDSLEGEAGERGIGIYKYNAEFPDIGYGYTTSNYTNSVQTGVILKINDLLLGTNNIIAIVDEINNSEGTKPNRIHCKSILDIKGATGDSAYETWLAAGNTGTEDEFLNSLKGENGERGTAIYKSANYFSPVGYGNSTTDYAEFVPEGVIPKVNDLLLSNNYIIARVHTVGHPLYPKLINATSILNIKGAPGNGIPDGYNPNDIFIINNTGDPQFLKGQKQIVIESYDDGYIGIEEYARKITVIDKVVGDTVIDFLIEIYVDDPTVISPETIKHYEDIDIIYCNHSDLQKYIVVGTSGFNQSFTTFNGVIILESMDQIEISLRPFLDGDYKLSARIIRG